MLKFLAIASAAVILSGCGSVPVRDRVTLTGAVVGAGIGAAVGSATAGPPGGWAGAAIGYAAGGFVGYLIQPGGCYYRNRRGEMWQVSCEGKFAGHAACYTGNDLYGYTEVPCPGRRS